MYVCIIGKLYLAAHKKYIEIRRSSSTNCIYINLHYSLWFIFKEMFCIFVSSQSIPTAVQRLTAANLIVPFFVYIEEAHSTFHASEAQK
jgi:hypothetical protein